MRRHIKDPNNIWVVLYVGEDELIIVNGSITEYYSREQPDEPIEPSNNEPIVFTDKYDLVIFTTNDNEHKEYSALAFLVFNDKSSAVLAFIKALKRRKRRLRIKLAKIQNKHDELAQDITKLEQEK